MRRNLIAIIGALLLAASGFFAGYEAREFTDSELHAAFVEGQRDVTAYVEDCSLDRAHAGRCSLPCASEGDCVAKNGSRDNY